MPAADLPPANELNGLIESTAIATGAVAGGALLALVGIGPRWRSMSSRSCWRRACLPAPVRRGAWRFPPRKAQTRAGATTALLDRTLIAPRLLGRAFGLTDVILLVGAAVLTVAGLVALGGVSRGRSARRSPRLRRAEPIRSAS